MLLRSRNLLAMLVTLLSYTMLFAHAISIPSIKGRFQAPSLLQDLTPFSTPRQTPMRQAAGSSECTNDGSLYCCPAFIQSGSDGPCADPKMIGMVQECRKHHPHGMACCINERLGEWYCWSIG